MDTVSESKLNPHNMFNVSESTHLKSFIETGILFNPTSKKEIIERKVVININVHVIICDPVTPIFLPKKPDIIDPNKGSINIVKYII
jgi:hypothetical protein